MTLYWIVSSEDEPQQKISNHDLAYWITENSKMVALRPIVDTIALTIRAKDAHQCLAGGALSVGLPTVLLDYNECWKEVWKRLHLASGSDQFPTLSASKRRIPGYRHNLDVRLPGVPGVPLISYPTHLSDKAPLRLEFNANKLGQSGLLQLETVWNEVVGPLLPFRALFADARVTRLDVAIDLLNLDICDLFAHHQKLWKIWTVYHPDTGIQTIQHYIKHGNKKSPYLNPKSRADLLIYDKREEQDAVGLKPEYGVVPHVRIERSNDTNSKLVNLKKWKPNFDGWSFVRVDNASGKTKAEWSRYVDTIRVRGIQRAHMLHEGMPSTFIELAEQLPQDIIQPEFWELWQNELSREAVGLLTDWAIAGVKSAFEPAD